MERQIVIHQPKQVEIGPKTAGQIGQWASDAKRILLITSPSVAGLSEQLQLTGDVEIYSQIPAEPDDNALSALITHAAKIKPDCIIGLGGGSVMDMAKLASVLWDKTQQLDEIIGPNKVKRRLSQLALIPTTAGTGSEAGIRALVTNTKTHAKMAVESPYMCADIAVLDPELTLSVPPALTAVTGVDAMAHCVEAFTNIKAHSVIDGYARMGFQAVGQSLNRAVRDGTDIKARTAMMLASYYGGICLGPVNTAAGHALAYPLGTRLKLPHGLANALIFPHVLGFNQPVCADKTNEVLSALGKDCANTAQSAFEQAYDFCKSLDIDMRLSAYGAALSDLQLWAEEAHAIRRLMDNNPRQMSIEDIVQIYQAAF